MTTHVRILGTLFIVFGAFYVLLAFGSSILLGFLAALVGAQGGNDAVIGASVLGFTGAALFGFWLTIGIPGIVAGIGLLQLKRWARILGIVLSAISLIQFPFGTMLGGYGLWVLFNKDTEALFPNS
ncbi:MAG: hypothetical protein HQ485_16910 [Acidobacteria bacterium]|jgi:hypothetical protein|nr:hypothetical protein [Acidobacteriota bacterium]